MRGLTAAQAAAPMRVVMRHISYGDDEASLGAKLAAELSRPDAATGIIASNSSQAARAIRILRDLPGCYQVPGIGAGSGRSAWAGSITEAGKGCAASALADAPRARAR